MYTPLDYLNGWLCKMDASRVRPNIKEPLLRYQRECYRILAVAFIGQNTAVHPTSASDEPLIKLHNMALVIAATTREMLATKDLAQSNAERLDWAALVVQITPPLLPHQPLAGKTYANDTEATAGTERNRSGHRLAPWRRVTQPGLFIREATGTH
ncbi:MAG: phage antirepressor N-terminal domain-containing protein [Chloroflexota bacterium]